jgi:hypothetical protein
MSIKILALGAATLALASLAAPVSAAAAGAAPVVASATASDFSAARRHHRMSRNNVRNAYGAYVGETGATPQPTPYGYGVGDNSHNQTW